MFGANKKDKSEKKMRELLETLATSQVELRERQSQLYSDMRDLVNLIHEATENINIVKSDIGYLINTVETRKSADVHMKEPENLQYIG